MQVGEPNLKLCPHGWEAKCFKARIIAMAPKLPGFAKFSSYKLIGMVDPPAVVSEEQMKYMMKFLFKQKEVKIP